MPDKITEMISPRERGWIVATDNFHHLTFPIWKSEEPGGGRGDRQFSELFPFLRNSVIFDPLVIHTKIRRANQSDEEGQFSQLFQFLAIQSFKIHPLSYTRKFNQRGAEGVAKHNTFSQLLSTITLNFPGQDIETRGGLHFKVGAEIAIYTNKSSYSIIRLKILGLLGD